MEGRGEKMRGPPTFEYLPRPMLNTKRHRQTDRRHRVAKARPIVRSAKKSNPITAVVPRAGSLSPRESRVF